MDRKNGRAEAKVPRGEGVLPKREKENRGAGQNAARGEGLGSDRGAKRAGDGIAAAETPEEKATVLNDRAAFCESAIPIKNNDEKKLSQQCGDGSGVNGAEALIPFLAGADFWHTVGDTERGIPAMTMSDGPHGLRKQDDSADHLGIHDSIKAIAFPSAGCLASSFDREAAKRVGTLLAEECRAEGVHLLLGPAINLKRTPLNGRNFEYFSEDPLLTGELAKAMVAAIEAGGVGACVKHYLCNNQENGRMSVSANVSDRALHELYLPAFYAAISAKPSAVMSSYNRVNGEFVGESKRFLTEILRERWGFKGLVVSDWYAVSDRVRALRAGLDLEMPGGAGNHGEKLAAAYRAGELSAETIERSAERVQSAANRLCRARTAPYDKEAHHAAAAEIAGECLVLLKNERAFFPLNASERVLILGKFARKPRFQGGGSSHVNAYRVDAAADFFAGFNVDCPDWGDSPDVAETLQKLRAEGGNYDKILVFAGLDDADESEGYDRSDLYLPKNCDRLIEGAAQLFQGKVGVVSSNGAPIAMPWIDRVEAVLETQLAGEGIGRAVADALTGRINPSGRLAESYPLKIEHTPSYLFRGDAQNVDYGEGVFAGYRYYATKKIKTLFPFGYGLSYTAFRYKNPKVSIENGAAAVEVQIENVGDRAGKEAVLLFVSAPGVETDRPETELKEFCKIELDVMECKTVRFRIPISALGYYDEREGRFRTESGEYEFRFGKSAESTAAACRVRIEGEPKRLFADDNTTVGELAAHPATAETIEKLIGGYSTAEEGGGAIGAEMKRAMVLNAPLRLVRGIAKMDEAQYEAFLTGINAKLQKKPNGEKSK